MVIQAHAGFGNSNGGSFQVQVPQGIFPGMVFHVQIPAPLPTVPAAAVAGGQGFVQANPYAVQQPGHSGGMPKAQSKTKQHFHQANPYATPQPLIQQQAFQSSPSQFANDPQAMALEFDSRSNRNSNLLRWVHGACGGEWDPDLVGQTTHQEGKGSKKHLPWSFVTIPTIPSTVEQFLLLREQLGPTAGPESAAALFVVAMNVFIRDETVGKQCFVVACDASCLRDAKSEREMIGSYKGKRVFGQMFDDIFKRLKAHPFIATSFFFGSMREDGYLLEGLPGLRLKIKDCQAAQTTGDECFRHAWQGAAKMPRGMKLHRNSKGVWKVNNFASMLTAPPFPVVKDDDDI